VHRDGAYSGQERAVHRLTASPLAARTAGRRLHAREKVLEGSSCHGAA
jgi:hypothetical protein